MVRETRHLWVGNLPENVREDKIIEHFKRYGRVESVKILPKRGSEGGVAAFVDFVDIKSAQKAHNSVNKMGDRDLRTDYNEPGTIPSAARGLDDTVPIGTRTREVSGFRGGGGGPTYGPPPSLHGREGRYERRLDGASDNRERTYDHSAYGHHDRTATGFDRPRHYEQDYYRDPRDRTIQHGVYYGSRSRSPTRFEAHDPRYEQRGREQFAISSVVHRDLYREDITREVRGRRQEKNYQHSRSRSPHSSRSGNQSPQRSSQASRSRRSPSGSGSRSRSSSSDSVSSSSSTSSDSSDSSSSSSDESPARSVQSAAVPAPPVQLPTPVEKDEPRKSYGIKVQNLPVRSTDTSLKDGLFHEFKKYGKVTSVQIHGASEERYGLVFFRQQEDQEKAMNASKGKLFFGMQIEVTAWTGPETESENEFRPLDDRIDEFHPKATRTLFIGNLEKTTTYGDLRNIFERFGEIVDIDIKKVNGVPQYAFLQYCDIASVCKAIKKMDGEYLGNNRLKLGFGKSMPTNCVWLDGLSSNITEQYLSRHFCRYGPVLKVDFANRESQLAFYRSMEVSGQDIRDLYEIFAERRQDRRGSYHEYTADRAYFDAVRGPAAVFPEDPRRDYRARSRDFYAEWDPYQGDYYDPRYYEDPREYRDYRDPYEQDIREYSYRQRERERERERYESDRERDHERRTCERSQSPTHSRRAQSCSASPAQSERHQSDSMDSERRIYSRSSDRSGSCSSLSPPRYDKADKPDKIRADRYDKNEKEKERLFEPERADKRTQRKDKVEKLERTKKFEKSEVEKLDKKEKIEKLKIRKVKPPSPSSLSSETDHEVDRDLNPDGLKSKIKQGKEKAEKEGASKNRLDLIPCVVLTRVKEREAKMIEPLVVEKARGKPENDAVKSPPTEQNKVQLTRLDQTKMELSKLEPTRPKVPKEKPLASQIEVVDKEVKIKHKKNLKPEPCPEIPNALDIDKLEARKRRFADPTLRTDRQKLEVKRGSQEEEELRLGLKKQPELAAWRELPPVGKEGDLDRRPVRKELLKREHRKVKQEKLISAFSPREGQESASISVGIGLRPSIEAQCRLSEPSEEPVEIQETGLKKLITAKPPNKGVVQPLPPHLDEMPGEGEIKREERKRKYSGTSEDTTDHKSAHEKLQTTDSDEKVGIDIDYTQSYRKQMEQNRRLKQQQEMEMAKSEKYNSPRKENADEFERRSLVHEVGKPPQDVTDDSPPVKRRKTDQFDFEISMKRERNYRSSRQLSEDSEKTVLSPGFRHILSYQDEDDNNDSPHQTLIPKEPKDSPKLDSTFQVPVREEPLKCNAYESSRREQILDLARFKITSQSSDQETPRWETRLKLDASKADVSFPSSIIKRDGIRKRSVRELEPGEVPSDSDEDNEHKSHSPKASTSFDSSRLPLCLRNREDRLSDLKLSSSLERNKFYSFALDKTITPDTKALLERAKSLSSSREENWSFLDRDSRFASFRKDKDKEKVESAPRPIPSWYMKKKKIRTDSEGKIDEKKEDHKEDEQERQELFASRFLHSSIFEQDSKRLQHLERKEDDLDVISGRLFGRQGSLDGSSNMLDFIQEPVVLFHSRFIELTRMQQKEKEKDQKPKELERREIEKEVQPKTPEPVSELKEPDLKNTLPLLRTIVPPPPPPTTNFQAVPPEQQETVQNKTANDALVAESGISSSGENRTESAPVADTPKPVIVNVSPCEEMEPAVLDANVTSDPVATEQESKVREHPSYLDTKPPTPGGADLQEIRTNAEPEILEINAVSSKTVPKEVVPEEHKDDKNPPVSAELDINQKEEHSEIHPQISDNEIDTEPSVVLKEKKTSKSKRTKTPLQAVTAIIEKPVTRKSERIDREKLKRSSSPRGDTQKLQEQKLDVEKVSKNTAKSPSSAPESETSEPSLPLGRTRRRNVRSVYATVDDGPSLVKDSTDTTRSTRKRAEKEIQESPNVQTAPRRGRPPKARRRPGEEVPCFKTDQVKQDVEETETKDSTESTKPVEGWKSPRSQKAALSHSSTAQSHIGKKGVKTEPRTAEVCAEHTDDVAEPSVEQSSTSENIIKTLPEGNDIASDQKPDKNDGTSEKCPPTNSPGEIMEKRSSEKGSKSKCGRGRNAKASEDKMCLRNLEIRLSSEEVKGVLQPGDGEATGATKKDPLKNDSQSPKLIKEEAGDPFSEPPKSPEKEMAKPECSPEAVQRAKQIELERAVENIAKLTEIPTVHPYKETTDEPDVRPEEEVEKPAHQASETELAAAIDSIIADESAEPDSFPSAPRYPPDQAVAGLPEDQVVLPTPPDTLQPETDQAIVNILETTPDVGASGRLLTKAPPSNRLVAKIPASGRLVSKAPASGRSISKSPVSAESIVTEVPSSVESVVSEAVTSTDNMISKASTSTNNIVSETSAPVDSASTDSVISKAPVPLESMISKVSVTMESVISKAPVSIESVISKAPVSVESVISKAPVSVESVISKAPVSAESVISKVPISTESVVSENLISTNIVSPALPSNSLASKTLAVDSQSAVSVSSVSRSTLLTTVVEAKDADVCLQQSGNVSQKTESLPLPEPAEVPRASSRRGRSKLKITRRNRRGSTSRRMELADGNSSEPEPVPVSTDIKQNSVTAETVLEKCIKKSAVEPVCVSKSDTDNLTRLEEGKPGGMKAPESEKDPTTEAISPQDSLHSSACNEDNKSPPYFKLKQHSGEYAPEAQPKQSMSRIAINAFPTTTTAKISVTPAPVLGTTHISSGAVPDWMPRHEASRGCSTPPPAAPPPDTKASDLDTNSSTLRKILMEPKYVSATGVPTTFVTTAINEPLTSVRTEEAFPSGEVNKLVLDEKPAVPPSSTGGQQMAEMCTFNEKDKPASSLISPKVTSVISRMPPSSDQEEITKVTANSRGPANLPSQSPNLPTVSLTKQKYRSNLTENSRYKLGTFIGDESRPVDNIALNQGSSPRLRVNTSEGVVVLSYSGQKTEGPQRITAPISQIPPASAVDIEFQQSVSKSQAKPEPVSQSQPVTKGSQTPSGYSNVIGTHSSSILAGHGGSQSYNTSPVISSIKQEHQILEKSESAIHSGTLTASQPGAVKIVYNLLPNIVSTNKKGGEPVVPKIEAVKVTQQSTLSPGISSHHAAMPSKMQSDTNHISSGRGTPTERGLPVSIKQEPHSPRTSVHSPSPFPKVCQPSSTSTASQSMNANMVLNAGLTMTQFVPSVHLPEQSVIMPPHSVTQTQVVSLGHLSQGEVRMNAPSVPGIPYGIRPDTHHPSPRAVLQPQMELRSQRSSTPQSTVIRDLCMPQISNQHQPDEELLHYHGLRRGSGPLQPDVLVMQPDYRIHPGGLRLDQYNVPQEMLLRDVRMMYPPMSAVGDVHNEARQARTPDGSVKTPPASKTPQPAKEAPKTTEVKMAKSPHNEARLINVPPGMPMSQSVMVSHGVQLMHQVPSSFHDYPRVYQELRNFHPSHLGHPQFGGINLPSRSMTPQGISEGEHVHPGQRSKTPQISQDTKGPAAPEHPHHVSITRLPGQMELHSPHLQHLQRERVQPEANPTSYPSPTGVSMPIKHELSSPHQPPTPKQTSFISTQSSTPGAAPPPVMSRADPQTTGKQEPQPPSGSQRPVDMVQLLTKYPIVWQGLLALKNDTAAVQLHFVSGNNVLAHRSLPAPEGGPPLRIAQRMRLEATQLEGVARRMTVETDYCLLLALPCGRDQEDVVSQTESLKAGFISYLQLKQAAGIINVPNPGSNQPAYVLQIFPPCEFSESHLSRLAPDLLASISNISPHLMIVIASV
ncbi:msx2-interacting protein isoform X7 [Mustelus asterias]